MNANSKRTEFDPIEFLSAAADLRMKFEQRLRFSDDALSDEGVDFVVFAVDNDVVKMFSAPGDMGPKNETGGGGYGHIFPGDDKTSATAIATVLSEYLFSDELSEFPLLQLRPHAAETETILDGIVRGLNKKLDWRRTAQELLTTERAQLLENSLRLTDDHIGAIADIISSSSDLPPQEFQEFCQSLLMALLLGKHRLQTELVRLLRLYAEQRMLPISGLENIFERIGKNELASLFKEPDSIVDWYEIGENTRFWQPILAQSKRRTNTTRKTIQNDAAALAYLEYYNEKLSGYGGRLILITGDSHLLQCVNDNAPEKLANNVIDPRAFLIEALEATESEHGLKRPFRRSLDLLLMNFVENKRTYFEPELQLLADRDPKIVRRAERIVAASERGDGSLYQG